MLYMTFEQHDSRKHRKNKKTRELTENMEEGVRGGRLTLSPCYDAGVTPYIFVSRISYNKRTVIQNLLPVYT